MQKVTALLLSKPVSQSFMQLLYSLLWGNVSKYYFCNTITNVWLVCGQSVPSTLNFLQGLQMIKRITCLHISKLTLLGKVIKTVLHTKEQGCTYKWWKHTWKPWPRLPSAPSNHHCPSARHSSDPKVWHRSTNVTMHCSRKWLHWKGTWGWLKFCEGMLGGGNRTGEREKSEWLGEKQAWESQGYGDKWDRSPVGRLKISMYVQLCPAYPVRLLISFCISFLGLCLVPMCIYKTWSQTTGHKGWWLRGASKAGCELLQVWA